MAEQWDISLPLTENNKKASFEFEDWLFNAISKNNYKATINPSINDDINNGYIIGSEWLNTTTNIFYKCASNSSGDAIWIALN